MRPVFKINTTSTTEQQHCLHQNRLLFEVDNHLEEEE